MANKPLALPIELKLYQLLNLRMTFSQNEKNYYINLEKGFEGEQAFAELLENMSKKWIVLNDLLLESNHSLFQVDSLLLLPGVIYLFEVKNYDGDFYIESDSWYTQSGKEIKNPIQQLSRTKLLLRQFLQNHGYDHQIIANVIFINPQFTLYHAPLNLPFILPTQLPRFLNRLKTDSASNVQAHHQSKLLAKQLISAHIKESHYTNLPNYEYDSLKKGITCASCHAFLKTQQHQVFVMTCYNCGHEEHVDKSVLRAIKEFELLFPDRKVTTNIIYEWCDAILSKRTIRRILGKHFNKVGHGKYTYYTADKV